jgi:hypothetical protein
LRETWGLFSLLLGILSSLLLLSSLTGGNIIDDSTALYNKRSLPTATHQDTPKDVSASDVEEEGKQAEQIAIED